MCTPSSIIRCALLYTNNLRNRIFRAHLVLPPTTSYSVPLPSQMKVFCAIILMLSVSVASAGCDVYHCPKGYTCDGKACCPPVTPICCSATRSCCAKGSVCAPNGNCSPTKVFLKGGKKIQRAAPSFKNATATALA